MDRRDYLESLGWLDHSPGQGYPRSDVVGEQVYAARWSEYMRQEVNSWREDWCATPNAMLSHILDESPYRLTQLHATLCARIVCWFGSNCGRCFVEQATKRAKLRAWDNFQCEWAVENGRRGGINGGFRTLEYLASARLSPHHGMFGGGPAEGYGFITSEHWETADLLMAWLGTEAGTAFMQGCLREISDKAEADKLARRAALSQDPKQEQS
jgi:hypothetical protein